MNLKKQQGFTLIELMIVIAIIAILAAIALPAYQDYIIRSQVSEGATLLDGTKTAIAEYYNNKGKFPTANSSAGLALPASIQGSYVVSVGVDAGGTGLVIAHFSNTAPQKSNANINGKSLELSAITVTGGGSIQFKCKSVGTVINDRYLPTTCRS